MSYTVNTKISLHPTVNTSDPNILTVLALVDSKSNFSNSAFRYIPTIDWFEYYYNDKYAEYSKSLLQAQRVLSFGYNVLTYNVHRCEYPESARIYNDNQGGYISSWFDPELDVTPINTVLHSDKHLAVKFKLSELTAGHYVLLEHTINGRQSNCYIGDWNVNPHTPLISSVNYDNSAAHEFVYDKNNPDESVKKFIQLMSQEDSYTCAYTSDGYIHLMFPYEFSLSEGVVAEYNDPRRISVEYDEIFLAQYQNNVRYNTKILDLYSKYNSDLEDLAVEFFYQSQTYYAAVYKYQNGTNILETENFSEASLSQLYTQINYNSKYVRVQPYSDEFPIGNFKLKQLHSPKPTTFDDYLAAVDFLKEYVDEDYDFNANIVLEPDLDLDIEQQRELQQRISNAFYNVNNMCIKFFNYIGLQDNRLTCYVDNSEYLYKTEVFNTKMLLLKMLIAGSRVVNLNEIVQTKSDNNTDLPYYVNKPRVGFEYINFQKIKTLLYNRLYYVYDMLVISCVNSQTNSSNYVKNRIYFYDLIEMLTNYFTKHFGYDPQIFIRSYTEHREQNKAQVSIGYTVSDLSEVKFIDLLLDLYGTAQN